MYWNMSFSDTAGSFIQAYIVIVKHVKPYQTSCKRLDPLNPLWTLVNTINIH